MKSIATSLVLISIAMASHAQQTPGASPQSKSIDTSRLQGVAGPNRTASMTMADSGKSGRHWHGGRNWDSSGADAILWVDSTGRTIGRAISSNTVLLNYENQLTALTGLEADQTCTVNGCVYNNAGNRWSSSSSVYYPSADCTGTPYLQPYLPYGGFGTPSVGIPVVDGDTTYIYLFKVTDTKRVTVGSSYSNHICYFIRSGFFELDAAPVTAVVPASAFGQQPYFLK
jgi:hypothetical protein